MAYNLTAKGIIRERTAVLLEQRDYGQALEEDTERAKPTMAVPKSALSKLAEGEAFDIPQKPDNGIQIQEDKKPTKWDSEPKKYTGRRKNARVLDMNWKLDTYFVEKGAWIYMDKSNKERVFDWEVFEENHSGATF
ncbi:hypothetical protein F4821DRAFT_277016 [Hypoxylon rubiginosum]|uniref:Uncharacterized protein n=1 Tax=Hypoxylon rubiginosum TaxID=110542 RepID=A0ACC0D8K1_9PEZI|nr:hypothetical protein F4821DRAFT_277016 [Hypoxylon rubiginosum]